MVKLADYIFQYLSEKGVQHAFMMPGGGAMHLDDSLGRSGMEYTCFLHEQAAAVAAEAYGQHKNSPGLLLVTSGPGATNAITGVAAAWIDSTPMIVISGQAKREDLVGNRKVRQTGSQEVQIIPMVSCITKYAVQVLEPEKIGFYLEKAWTEAVTGRPGPVWLDIPLDVQAAAVDVSKMEKAALEHKESETNNDENDTEVQQAVEKTADLLLYASKPLILAGNGIKISGALEELHEVINLSGAPVQTTWKAVDLFGEDEECYVGHPGIMGDRGANLIVQEADFILSIGCRLDTSITAFNDRHFGQNAKKAVVDIDAAEIARMDFEKEAAAVCDAGVFLRRLAEVLRQKVNKTDCSQIMKQQAERRKWLSECHKYRAKYPVITKAHKDVKGYVSAYYFIGELCRLLKEDDVIVPESSGGAGEITYQAFQLKKGQKMKNAAGLGSMGFGLPYAIGSCIANDRKRTILINGDGAFQLNIQELETLHRLQLPVKIFIWNNGGYASIRSMQRNNFEGRYVASSIESGLSMPDISRVAQAYGFQTCTVHDHSELDRLLPEIMADQKPILCELMVLPEETVSPRVKAFVGEDGKMTSGLLEQMWPYVE